MIKEAIENLDVVIDGMTEWLNEMQVYIHIGGGEANMLEEEHREFMARLHYFDGLIQEREVMIKYLG